MACLYHSMVQMAERSSNVEDMINKSCPLCSCKIKRILRQEHGALMSVKKQHPDLKDTESILKYTQSIHHEHYQKILDIVKSHECYSEENVPEKTDTDDPDIVPTKDEYSWYSYDSCSGPRMCHYCGTYGNHWGKEFFKDYSRIFACYTCCEASHEKFCKESKCHDCKDSCCGDFKFCETCQKYFAKKHDDDDDDDDDDYDDYLEKGVECFDRGILKPDLGLDVLITYLYNEKYSNTRSIYPNFVIGCITSLNKILSEKMQKHIIITNLVIKSDVIKTNIGNVLIKNGQVSLYCED